MYAATSDDLMHFGNGDLIGIDDATRLNASQAQLKTGKNSDETALPVISNETNKLNAVLEQMTMLNEGFAAMQRTIGDMKEQQEKKWAQNERKISEMRSDLHKMAPKENESTGATTSTKEEPNSSIVDNPQIQQLRMVNDYNKEKADFTWIVTNARGFFSGCPKELLSAVFPLSGYSFGAQAKMKLYNNVSFKLSLCFKDTNRRGRRAITDCRPVPNISFTFKNQRNDEEDAVASGYYSYLDSPLRFDAFHEYSIGNIGNQYLKLEPFNVDDTVVIKIHVERPEVAQTAYSYNGSLTWEMEEYAKKKRMEHDGLTTAYLSPYFYTGPQGHRVLVKVYANGFGQYASKGLSVSVHFLNGVYDKKFHWPVPNLVSLLYNSFDHRTTVTLFHPNKPYLSISKSEEKVSREYIMHIGTHADVEKLLYNDTLYYKVSIEEIVKIAL